MSVEVVVHRPISVASRKKIAMSATRRESFEWTIKRIPVTREPSGLFVRVNDSARTGVAATRVVPVDDDMSFTVPSEGRKTGISDIFGGYSAMTQAEPTSSGAAIYEFSRDTYDFDALNMDEGSEGFSKDFEETVSEASPIDIPGSRVETPEEMLFFKGLYDQLAAEAVIKWMDAEEPDGPSEQIGSDDVHVGEIEVPVGGAGSEPEEVHVGQSVDDDFASFVKMSEGVVPEPVQEAVVTRGRISEASETTVSFVSVTEELAFEQISGIEEIVETEGETSEEPATSVIVPNESGTDESFDYSAFFANDASLTPEQVTDATSRTDPESQIASESAVVLSEGSDAVSVIEASAESNEADVSLLDISFFADISEGLSSGSVQGPEGTEPVTNIEEGSAPIAATEEESVHREVQGSAVGYPTENETFFADVVDDLVAEFVVGYMDTIELGTADKEIANEATEVAVPDLSAVVEVNDDRMATSSTAERGHAVEAASETNTEPEASASIMDVPGVEAVVMRQDPTVQIAEPSAEVTTAPCGKPEFECNDSKKTGSAIANFFFGFDSYVPKRSRNVRFNFVNGVEEGSSSEMDIGNPVKSPERAAVSASSVAGKEIII